MRCQYLNTSIELPSRSVQCSIHYHPFDLKNFIKIASTVKEPAYQRWHCPVCKVRAYDLVIDEILFKHISRINFPQSSIKQLKLAMQAGGEISFEEQLDESLKDDSDIQEKRSSEKQLSQAISPHFKSDTLTKDEDALQLGAPSKKHKLL